MEGVCDYGCGNEALYKLRNGKCCCCEIQTKCPAVRKKNSEALKKRFENPKKHPMYGKIHTEESLNRMRRAKLGKVLTEEHRNKIGLGLIGKMSGEKNPMYGVRGPAHHFYGSHHTEEAKKKISESNKKRESKPLSEEHKDAIRRSMLGRTISFEWRSKISRSRMGMKPSEETRRKLSECRQGSNHPNWKGGISCEPYCDAWADQEYKESIKDRDNHICQNPDCRKNCDHLPLTIHHVDYDKKNCRPDNLITLCFSCNSRANFNRDFWQDKFSIMLSYKCS